MSAVSAARRKYAGKIAKIKGKEGSAKIFRGVGKELGDLVKVGGQLLAPTHKKWKNVEAGAKAAGAEVKMPGKLSFDWFKDPSKVMGDEAIVGQTGYDEGKGVTKRYTAADLEALGAIKSSTNPLVKSMAGTKQGKEMMDNIGTKLSGSANVSGMTKDYVDKRLREMPLSRDYKTGQKRNWTVDSIVNESGVEETPKGGILKAEYGQYKSKFDLSMSPDTRDNYQKAFGGSVKMPEIPKDKGIGMSLEKYVPPSMPQNETSVIDDPSFNEKSLADRTEALERSNNAPGGSFAHKWNQTDSYSDYGDDNMMQSIYGMNSYIGSKHGTGS